MQRCRFAPLSYLVDGSRRLATFGLWQSTLSTARWAAKLATVWGLQGRALADVYYNLAALLKASPGAAEKDILAR